MKSLRSPQPVHANVIMDEVAGGGNAFVAIA